MPTPKTVPPPALPNPLRPEAHDVAILAVDPSTAITGAALVTFTAGGTPRLVSCVAFDAHAAERLSPGYTHRKPHGTDASRFYRIRWTAEQLHRWANNLDCAVDCLAYEQPNMRGAGPTAAIHQAIGAYLSRAVFLGVMPVYPVHATTVKACTIGGDLFRAKGTTAADRDEKGRMVAWAYQTFGVCFERAVSGRATEEGEAMADSCAVALGAYRAMQKPAPAKKPRRPVKGAKQQP